MKYLNPSFSINNAGNQKYAEGWDAIFGKKDDDDAEDVVFEPEATSDIRRQVEEFHRVYEIPVAEKPCVPEEKLLNKQLRCIGEEFIELLEACGAQNWDIEDMKLLLEDALYHRDHSKVDLVEVADASGDLDYTVESLRLVAGINGKPIADEIQRSNMSKLDENGKPLKREDGKILKGPNFKEPDIRAQLVAQGWEG